MSEEKKVCLALDNHACQIDFDQNTVVQIGYKTDVCHAHDEIRKTSPLGVVTRPRYWFRHCDHHPYWLILQRRYIFSAPQASNANKSISVSEYPFRGKRPSRSHSSK